MPFCPDCGSPVPDNSSRCPICGAEIKLPVRPAAKPVDHASFIEKMPVTTCDIHQDYEIISPVYCGIANYFGKFSGSQFDHLMAEYTKKLQDNAGKGEKKWAVFVKNCTRSDSPEALEAAFYIGVEELKKRAAFLGANAVIGMRQEVSVDKNSTGFCLQLYGTAVKLK